MWKYSLRFHFKEYQIYQSLCGTIFNVFAMSFLSLVTAFFQTQNVTLERIYQGCYRLGYTYKVDKKPTPTKLMKQYLKTAYIKDKTPCHDTYITPNNIQR